MTPWADFNVETLNESYGHILDLEVPMEQLAGAPRAEHVLQGIEINNPNHMMHLTGWNDRVLRPTLGFAKQHLGLHTGVHLHHFVLTPTNPCHVRITNTHHPLHIDHFVALDDFTSPNLVIGLTRPSPNFQGRRLINHPQTVSGEGFWALRQLANLCDKAETRYGYIVTDGDLVVCCFFKPDAAAESESSERKNLKVALMPVPWTRHGAGQLTTDMALWWLSMLALSPTQHRALVTQAEMVGIGEWEVHYLDDGRGWVRRHRYSNAEQPVDLPPPPTAFDISPNNNPPFHPNSNSDFIDYNLLFNPNNNNNSNNFNFNFNFGNDDNGDTNLLFNPGNNPPFSG